MRSKRFLGGSPMHFRMLHSIFDGFWGDFGSISKSIRGFTEGFEGVIVAF